MGTGIETTHMRMTPRMPAPLFFSRSGLHAATVPMAPKTKYTRTATAIHSISGIVCPPAQNLDLRCLYLSTSPQFLEEFVFNLFIKCYHINSNQIFPVEEGLCT